MLIGAGCALTQSEKEPGEKKTTGSQDYPKTVTDSVGRTVTIEKPLERIVIIFPQLYEVLRTIGVSSDIVVGVAKESPPYDLAFFPELASVPSVGGRWDPDVEAILALQPDAVFIYPGSGNQGGNELDEAADDLEAAGITVLRFGDSHVDIFEEELTKLGYIFDKSKEAKEHLAWRKDILSLVTDRVAQISEEDKPSVYFMPNIVDGVYYIYGQYSYIEMTGGIDIFADQPGKYMTIDTEEILKRNPDIIVRVAPMGL